MKVWLEAFRLRTLPLSLACIFMGSFLAYGAGMFSWSICALSIVTTVLLQILSNLANDYGDSVHGADHSERKGPSRAVQSGAISAPAMKRAMVIFAVLALVTGTSLLVLVFLDDLKWLFVFLGIGLISIWAAITYTSGKNPYGYKGLGDISVFFFFGIVGVLGTYFLQVRAFDVVMLLPAMSCGLFATGVLNVNNIRDIESDQLAGKRSIPVRIGRENAVNYHWFLLSTGFVTALVFTFITFQHIGQFSFILLLPLFLKNGVAVSQKKEPQLLDPFLKQLAISTLLFVLMFGFGFVLTR